MAVLTGEPPDGPARGQRLEGRPRDPVDEDGVEQDVDGLDEGPYIVPGRVERELDAARRHEVPEYPEVPRVPRPGHPAAGAGRERRAQGSESIDPPRPLEPADEPDVNGGTGVRIRVREELRVH